MHQLRLLACSWRYVLLSAYFVLYSTATAASTCIVPLSPQSNQGYVVNDNADGITQVNISIVQTKKSIDASTGPFVSIHTQTQGYSSTLHIRCLAVQSRNRTVAETCEDAPTGAADLTWKLDTRSMAGWLVAHAFVRSKVTNMVLSIASRELAEAPNKMLLRDLPKEAPTVDILVMSKDRPLEVEALLDSVHRLCIGFGRIVVLFLATDTRAEAKYALTAARYPHVIFIPQKDFRQDVLAVVGESRADFMFPVVGEMVFIRPFNFTEAIQHLHDLGPYSTMHPRLGTQLKLFQELKRRFGEKFHVPLNEEQTYGIFDATLAQQNVCVEENYGNASQVMWQLNGKYRMHPRPVKKKLQHAPCTLKISGGSNTSGALFILENSYWTHGRS